jgi:hypothetical protein
MALAPLFVPRNVLDEAREMTRKACVFASVVVSSSVRPSAKYSFSGSVLRFAKGSTAMDRVGADAGPETLEWDNAGSLASVCRQASTSDLSA